VEVRTVNVYQTELCVDLLHGKVRNNSCYIGFISKCAGSLRSLDHAHLVVHSFAAVVAYSFQHVASVATHIDFDIAHILVRFHRLQGNLSQPSRNGIKHQRRVTSVLNLRNLGCHIVSHNGVSIQSQQRNPTAGSDESDGPCVR